MMLRRLLLALAVLFIAACRPPAVVQIASPIPATPAATVPLGPPIYNDPAQPLGTRVNDLLARMTLAEKIGQMTQVEKDRMVAGDVAAYFIGSVLSGGGEGPDTNTA